MGELEQKLLAWNGQINIWQAVAKGNIVALKDFLSRGVDINIRSSGEDITPLTCAVDNYQTAVVRFLLEQGADPNIRDLFGWSPLMYASAGGQIEVARMLLEEGADPNIEDLNKPGETALVLAQRKGHIEIVNLLKRRGAKK